MSDLNEIYENFWYAEEGEVLSGASKDAIARKEDELSVKLPDELKQLLMISDGGVVHTLDATKELVEQFGLDWRNEYDFTLCQLAASDGALTTLQRLIEMGADPSGSLKFSEANKRHMVADYLRTHRIE